MSSDNIMEKYPDLFRQSKEKGSPMAFGVECGDGWQHIVDAVCESLDGRGVEFRQIKEKFGSLRIYWSAPSDSAEYVAGVIALAEAVSERTCESCGGPGERRGNGWIVTLCDECYSS
jgi:hypothetical protein